MALVDRNEKPRNDSPVPQESPKYQAFLRGHCHGEPSSDGIFRNASGARFCSCDMCGMVSAMNVGGKEFCNYHYGHTGTPQEAAFWTEKLHELRPLVVIANVQPHGLGSEYWQLNLLQLFDETLERFHLPPRGEATPYVYIVRHIEALWAEKVKRDAAARDQAKSTADERQDALTKRIEAFADKVRAMPMRRRVVSPRTPEPPFPDEEVPL